MRRKKILGYITCLFILIMLALHGSANAASGKAPAIGDPAPAIELEELLKAPDGATATLAALQGKVVVLEFWATWCAPCVAQFPHLNDLVKSLKANDDVVFISISDESRSIVEKFLEKKPLKTWIGIDSDRSMFNGYRVIGVPKTVIVDKQGKIAAITYPSMVSEQALLDVAAGKPANLPQLPSMPGGEMAEDGPGMAPPGGMPGSVEEMNKWRMAQTVPGKAHDVLKRLAGHWTVQTTHEPILPGGASTKMTGEVSRSWLLGGRVLQSRNVLKSEHDVESVAMLGYDADKGHYFMDEYSPLESAPVHWAGHWDEASLTLRFERSIEVCGMGGPVEGSAMQAEMVLEIAFGENEAYNTTLSISLPDMSKHMPPGAEMSGNGSGKQVISTSVARRSDRS